MVSGRSRDGTLKRPRPWTGQAQIAAVAVSALNKAGLLSPRTRDARRYLISDEERPTMSPRSHGFEPCEPRWAAVLPAVVAELPAERSAGGTIRSRSAGEEADGKAFDFDVGPE
jgi:hypothetical protein